MAPNQQALDIGDVAKSSGLPTSTLRYYESQGLIQSIGRHGLRRQFGSDVLQRLALITLGRNAGFSLDEIKTMLTPKGPVIDRAALSAKADEIDKDIQKLKAMRDGLRHAAKCPAPSHLECPKFLRVMGISAKKSRKLTKTK